MREHISITKSEKGITLLTLIITIIVMLILAVVNFTIIFGEEGIIAQAQIAKTKTEEAYEEESTTMGNRIVDQIQSIVNKKKGFVRGSGTEIDPYIIEYTYQLEYLAEQVNSGNDFEGKFIKITKDLYFDSSKEFIPIGSGMKYSNTNYYPVWDENAIIFNGTLYADEVIKITGININKPTQSGVGLIGALGSSGKIENIQVDGSIIGQSGVGGIAGASCGNIINCTNKAKVIAQDNETSNTGEAAGGIVGLLCGGSIEGCLNYGNVTAKNNKQLTGRGKYAGGIVGDVSPRDTNEIKIISCENRGTITSEYQQVGGIVGGEETSDANIIINSCNNFGKIYGIIADYIEYNSESGNYRAIAAGGIAGLINKNTKVINCINTGIIEAKYDRYVGGIIGYCPTEVTIDHTNVHSGSIEYLKVIE